MKKYYFHYDTEMDYDVDLTYPNKNIILFSYEYDQYYYMNTEGMDLENRE